MNTKTCFDILGIPVDASLDKAKQSYKRLVKRWHPDQYGNDPQKQRYAHEKLTEINVAYREVVAILKTVRPPVSSVTEKEETSVRHGGKGRTRKKKASIFKRMASILGVRKSDMGAGPGKTRGEPRQGNGHDFDTGGRPASEFQRVLKRAVRNQPRITVPGKSHEGRRKHAGRASGRPITPGNHAPPRRDRGDRVEKIRPVRRVGKI